MVGNNSTINRFWQTIITSITVSGFLIFFASCETYAGETWETIFDGEYIQKMSADSRGNVCIIKPDGLYSFNGALWKHVGLPYIVGGIVDFEHDKNDSIWITSETEIVRYSNGVWTYVFPDRQHELGFINCIEFDENNHLWIGTEDKGLFKYTDTGEELRRFTREDGLVSDSIGSLAIGSNGVVWVGAGQGSGGTLGISRYDGSQWVKYDWYDGFTYSSVHTIAISPLDGTVWCGVYKGLYSFDGQTWRKYTTQEGLVHDYVNDISIDLDGNIWIAAGVYASAYQIEQYEGGLSCFDGEGFINYTSNDGLVFDCVREVEAVSPTDIFCGTRKGLSHLTREIDVNVNGTENEQQQVRIIGNYPNPFNETTDIRFFTGMDAVVEITVFSIHGQKICKLFDDTISTGFHSIRWDGMDSEGNRVSSGIYVIILTSKPRSDLHKLLYLQ